MTKSNEQQALLIAGPTASGKSAVALELAMATGGAIINADSMQVYRDLRVLTARPPDADLRRAEHHLYGYVDAAESCSVGRWLADMERVLKAVRRRGKRPVIVGGTGLYFKALTEGLAPLPDIPADIRRYWRSRARDEGAAVLHRVLQQRDPALAARLRDTDPQRLARALEVLEATGKSLLWWQSQPPQPPLLPLRPDMAFVLAPERSVLYGRIDRRFGRMLSEGALDEVAKLAARRLDPALPLMKALGVPELMAYLAGKMTRATAVEKAGTLSRRYAKRQMTWARSNMISWNRVNGQEKERIAEIIFNKIQNPG
ncbi:MAG TPA: tRNA (adenosine(37)-N6)-dimethylallyltransferase MiaA [Rhodobacteraceae bacterium]|nr:tRNA (adenosine(37)-N6)-dimethylallyltransferase MiaA [Paracoccaceae bacterium]